MPSQQNRKAWLENRGMYRTMGLLYCCISLCLSPKIQTRKAKISFQHQKNIKTKNIRFSQTIIISVSTNADNAPAENKADSSCVQLRDLENDFSYQSMNIQVQIGILKLLGFKSLHGSGMITQKMFF